MSLKTLGPAAATLLLVGLLGAGSGSGARTRPEAVLAHALASSAAAPAPPTPTLYGLAGPPPRLYRVDPRTLRARPDGSAPVNGHAFGWSFSPDWARLAAGSDVTAELRIYDLSRLRALGDVKVNSRGLVYATTWASRSRVLAAVLVPGCCGLGDTIVTGVDADSRRVLWRRDLRGSLQAGAAYRGGFVLVLGPRWAIGLSRLVVVAPDGRMRTTRLDQIRSGWQRYGGSPISHQWNPGLAPRGRPPYRARRRTTTSPRHLRRSCARSSTRTSLRPATASASIPTTACSSKAPTVWRSPG